MKSLLILRHAKSSWKNSELADHDRPLKRRGKKDAPRVGELLKEQGLVPDRILSSTAKRAKDTAALVAEACEFAGAVEPCGDLYPGTPSAYIGVLAKLPGAIDRVLVVGHNPGLELLLGQLVGEAHVLPTAALAHVELPIDSWQALSSATHGRMVDLWRPPS